MREHYITAVLQLLAEGAAPAKVIDGLKRTLKTHDHLRLLPTILRGVLRHLENGNTKQGARVYVAREDDVEKLTATIKKHLATLGASESPLTVVSPALIGGVVVEHGNRRVDASYKRALTELYDRVTNA